MNYNPGSAKAVDRPFDFPNISFLFLTPIIGFGAGSWYILHYGITWLEVLNCFIMYMLTGIGITAGYHRYYAHRTYECAGFLKAYYLLFGGAAAQNSVLNWASDHRYHHRFVDTDADPYNVKKGGLWAHVGWIFYKNTEDNSVRYKNVPDLLKDRWIMWQDRWYLAILAVVSFGLPACIGLLEGRPWGGLLWGGFIRVVLVHHTTFFINSLAHLYGSQTYSLDTTARDSWWLGPISFGEGYHSFHHKFQFDYRNGIRWYHFDIAKWMIHCFSKIGWTWRLSRTPEPMILRARLEVQRRQLAIRLAAAGASQKVWGRIQVRLEAASLRLEQAMAQYQAAKLEYGRQKDEWSAEAGKQFAARIESCRDEFLEARKRWAEMLRAMNRISQPSAQGLLTFTAVVDILKTRLF